MAKPLKPYSLRKFEKFHVHPKEGRTLIVGSHVYDGKEDRRLRYPEAVGVDMLPGPGVDLVVDLEESLPEGLGTFDHVECMSVMEHSRRPWLMAENIERLMAPGATLFLTVPFIWRIHGYPDDYFRFTPHGIKSLFPNIRWEEMMMASLDLVTENRIRGKNIKRHPYLPRTEVVGFGVRK